MEKKIIKMLMQLILKMFTLMVNRHKRRKLFQPLIPRSQESWLTKGEYEDILNQDRLEDCILFTVTAHQGWICIQTHQIHSYQVHILNVNSRYLPKAELHAPNQLDLPREAKSEYCPLRRNKSTATCCPEQSKANFL